MSIISAAPQLAIPIPPNLLGRPRDHRGFVIPYFVQWLDDSGNRVEEPNGTPDFRISDQVRFRKCIRDRVCWLCGKPLGRWLAFVIGPMCAITRTTSEPGSHLGCARYAVMACPFLARPRMRRNAKDMPLGFREAPGITIDRNPGVSAIWRTTTYKLFRPELNATGTLITVGDPVHVEWWCQGREATRAEVMESIDSGLPALREVADKQGHHAREELEQRFIPRLAELLPP